MRHLLLSLGLSVLGLAQIVIPNSAQAEQLGYGRLIVNDFLGDGHDRWRSGSIVGSHVFGPKWKDQLPEDMGEIVELRILGQIIAPSNLQSPPAGDRPYAAALSVGAHTHFQRNSLEFSLGGDLTILGPQNGLGDFQNFLHDSFGIEGPSSGVLGSQVGNKTTLSAVAEVGKSLSLGSNASLRPFLEARAGDETLVRAGFDLTIGNIGQGDLLVRDPITGLRYRTIQQREEGMAFFIGADIAYVDSSIYLPTSSGISLENTRHRIRAGLEMQRKKYSIYYGASWLSPEFSGQPEGQVLGAIRIKFDF